jgi:hypothetical protein
MIAHITISDYRLACALGARRLPQTGPYVFIEGRDNAPVLFWPLDPKLVEEARAI